MTTLLMSVHALNVIERLWLEDDAKASPSQPSGGLMQWH